MGLVLKGLTCCLAYIDDTICHSPSFEAHIADLETVFDRFRQANLKLKGTKCKLFQERCRFVGHIISSNGVEVLLSMQVVSLTPPSVRTAQLDVNM